MEGTAMCHHVDDRVSEIVELTEDVEHEDIEDGTERELAEESDDPVAATADD